VLAISQWLPLFNHKAGSADVMRNRIAHQLIAPWAARVRISQCCAASLIGLASLFGGGTEVRAQTQIFVIRSSGTLNENATPCNNPLVRNFQVTNSFMLADVDIGVRGVHTNRGDLNVTLQHPDGTRVQVVNSKRGISGQNFNFRLDDAAAQTVNTDGNTAAHTGSAVNGGFQHQFRPNSSLSAFNNKTSQGTWRLEICDAFNQDSGTFNYSELYLTPASANSADLSLAKTVSNATPKNAQQISYTLSLTNSSVSLQTAAAAVRDLLPAGVQYVSHSGYGNYNAGSGDWTIASIAPGQTRTLTIVASVTASSAATITNTAQVTVSNRPDLDSTPNNNLVAEDDFAAVSFTVSGPRTAGIPPTLVCPNGSLAFDWAGRSWPLGSEAANYTLTGFGSFNWSLQNPAAWMNIASFGGIHPRLTTAAQNTTSLSMAIDFANPNQIATATVSLGEVVDGSQFTIFDVDFANNDFADFVRVTGRLGSATVIPVLSNGTANYVIGNAAYGDAGSNASDPDGNVVVTFNQAIDTIVIEYGNHSAAPANPDGQAIQIGGNIVVCRPVANLTVLKSSTLIDDMVTGEGDPFAIPGAKILYCISVTNNGSATARTIEATDQLPVSLNYLTNSIKSGASCASAATPEDDDAIGTDETDPVGASFANGTMRITVSELAKDASALITFQTEVK
jgi:uncharacterized repeat protein (TIGR01451 family)